MQDSILPPTIIPAVQLHQQVVQRDCHDFCSQPGLIGQTLRSRVCPAPKQDPEAPLLPSLCSSAKLARLMPAEVALHKLRGVQRYLSLVHEQRANDLQ